MPREAAHPLVRLIAVYLPASMYLCLLFSLAYLGPAKLQQFTPNLWDTSGELSPIIRLQQRVDRLTHHECFRLGAVSRDILGCLEKPSAAKKTTSAGLDCDTLRAELDGLLWKNATSADIEQVAAVLHARENQGSAFSRALGLLSFVNLIWVVSIFGVTIAIVPVLSICFLPVIKAFITAFVWLYTNVVKPLYRIIEPFLAYLLYLCCFAVVVHATRYENPNVQFYIALTGLAMAMVVLVLTAVRTDDDTPWLLFMVVAGNFGILAPHFQSLLLAYLGMAGFCSAIGFTVIPFPLGLLIGFNSRSTMYRAMSSSFVVLVLFIAAKAAGLLHATSPFRIFLSPVSVMGLNVFMLGMLISSSGFCYYGKITWRYFALQAAYAGILGALVMLGSVLDMAGLRNTAIVYGFLFALDKSAELRHIKRMLFGRGEHFFWIGLLFLSVVGYYVSMYLNQHPELLLSLFTSLA